MSMKWRHYVYFHIRHDNGSVFYVGKGAFRKNRNDEYERAYTTHCRNKYWHNIVLKHGFDVLIIASCIDDKSAQFFEKSFIKEIGRDNLCNMTDGGDGHCGIMVSDELRLKRSKNAQGTRSKEWVDSIRAARKNGGNGGVVTKGDRLPESWRNNISKAVSGKLNPMYGRNGKDHPASKCVIDLTTGVVFESVTEAAASSEYSYGYLHAMLSGIRPNKTTMVLKHET